MDQLKETNIFEMFSHPGYHWRSIESLYDKVRAMHRMVNEKQNRLLVIKQRYSKEERMNVASVTVNPHSNEEDLVSQDRA